jgi:PAS domain S-box-containing protein
MLTRFWHRRICEAAFLISFIILGLYFWMFFDVRPALSNSLVINFPAVVIAGVTAIISFVSYLWAPKKLFFYASLIVYLLLSATTAAIIVSTGNISSPFMALWMLISVFAGVFEFWGILPVFLTTSVFVAAHYIKGDFTVEMIITVVLASLLPLIIGGLLWYQKKDSQQASDSDNQPNQYRADELTELASKSEVVISAIGDGVIAVDSKGTIQLINPAAQSIIGWGDQDALSLNYKSVLQLVNQTNEALDINTDPIQQVLNTNQQIRTNDLSLLTKSGKKLMISLVASPVGDIGSGIIAVFHDITKEKAEEREQAEFISTASHEMRTPVASIEGYLGLALSPQTAQIDDRARDFITKAHDSAQHLGHLFQDLLDVSKADDGRMSNNPKVVNMVTFVNAIVQGLTPSATAKGLQLIYNSMPNDSVMDKSIAPIYSVNLDNDHIREIIDNLIDNAIKYTSQGAIVIEVTGDDDHIVVSVKDNGIGIPAEDMSHLFQKFYRVDNKDTRDIGGTGLGLYLSRRLAELMGGRIWAESVYTKGSTFYLELPRVNQQEADLLVEQEALLAQKPTATPTAAPEPPKQVVASSVPRSQALTPEQIAAYAAQQSALVKEQQTVTPPVAGTVITASAETPITAPAIPVAETNVRPQTVSVPARKTK